jgi:hypothetical protein
MESRGFLTLELLIALVLFSVSITGIAQFALGVPAALQDARIRLDSAIALDFFSRHEQPVSSWTSGVYRFLTQKEVIEDGIAGRFHIEAVWQGMRNQEAHLGTSSVLITSDPSGSCTPFIFGDWLYPKILRKQVLRDLLPATEDYSIGPVAASPGLLIVGMASTSQPTNSTLFFLRFDPSGSLLPASFSFDNASTSRIGIAALATSNELVLAANSFSSASPSTCNSSACAQLFAFTSIEPYTLQSAFQLSTTSPTKAVTVTGQSAAATSLSFRNGYAYLGLQKTAGGTEFNIIDMHNPRHPRWSGGVAIGRQVSSIYIAGSYAFLATDDNSRELVIIDISDASNPFIRTSLDASGSTNFGLGTSVWSNGDVTLLGRSYVNNASEFLAIDTHDLDKLQVITDLDPGTSRNPQSIRGVIKRDFLSFILTNRTLSVFDFEKKTVSVIDLPGAISLACRGNLLYVTASGVSGGELITLTSL